ncbi:hypothetical protein AVEN_144742-1 [Araneus ventricosus]|uniref:Uncharacterized protein n=1 Tax=Araneus ventricosus TaxID=182803 RepID=A0A4Y2A7F2_ARAVE|nr:hypothetical protein AVEN_144742-1 [Araneus ventricosus]
MVSCLSQRRPRDIRAGHRGFPPDSLQPTREDVPRFLDMGRRRDRVSIKFWTNSVYGKSVCLYVRSHVNTITQKLE